MVGSATKGVDPYADYYTPYGIIPSDDWINGYEEVNTDVIDLGLDRLPQVEMYGPYILVHSVSVDGGENKISGYKSTGAGIEKLWEGTSPYTTVKDRSRYNGQHIFSHTSNTPYSLNLETGEIKQLDWKSPFSNENGVVPFNELVYVKDYHSDLPVFCEKIPDDYKVDFSSNELIFNITKADVTKCAAFNFDSPEAKWVFDGTQVASSIPDDKVMILDLQTGGTSLVDEFKFFPNIVTKQTQRVLFKGKFPRKYRMRILNNARKVVLNDDFSVSTSELSYDDLGNRFFYDDPECKFSEGNMRTLLFNFDLNVADRLTAEAPKIPIGFPDSFLKKCDNLLQFETLKGGKQVPLWRERNNEAHLLYSPQRKFVSLVTTNGVDVAHQALFNNQYGQPFNVADKYFSLIAPNYGLLAEATDSSRTLKLVKARTEPLEGEKLIETSPGKFENKFFTIDIPASSTELNWEIKEDRIFIDGLEFFSYEVFSKPKEKGVPGASSITFVLFPPNFNIPYAPIGYEKEYGQTSEGYTAKIWNLGGGGHNLTSDPAEAAETNIALITLK